jgi:hypothetical protein
MSFPNRDSPNRPLGFFLILLGMFRPLNLAMSWNMLSRDPMIPDSFRSFNCVNVTAGKYLLPPLSPRELSAIVRGEKLDPKQIQELKQWWERGLHFGRVFLLPSKRCPQ